MMNEIDEMLKESMKKMIADNDSFYASQQKTFEENSQRIKSAQDTFLNSRKQFAEMQKDVLEIIAKLQGNPKLTAEVKKFIDEKLNATPSI